MNIALRLQLDDLAPQPLDLELLRLHWPCPETHAADQRRSSSPTCAACSRGCRGRVQPALPTHASFPRQLHRLELERPIKSSASHDSPPVPSSTLTRCP